MSALPEAGRPFHTLTDAEHKAICDAGMTYREASIRYPQPEWCDYPDAVHPLGCWSLTGRMVTGPDYCRHCECRKTDTLPDHLPSDMGTPTIGEES